MREETVQVRRYVNLVSIGLENAGLIEAKRDKHGELIGINLTIQAPLVADEDVIYPPTITQSEPRSPEPPSRG